MTETPEQTVEQIAERIERARDAVSVLRDAARLGTVIGFRERDPLVARIHRAYDTALAALRAERTRAEQAEAASEARRRTLFEKADALRLEGLRADNAEARAEQAEAELARLKPAPLTPDQARGIALLTDFQRDKRAFYSEERAAFAAVLALLDRTR